MDLRSQFAVVASHRRLILAGILLAAIAAFGASMVLPKSYESQATLLVGNLLQSTNPDQAQLQAAQSLSQTYIALATTRPILEKVISSLKLQRTADELRKQITTDQPINTSLLTISVKDADPTRAADIANAIATGLIESSPSGGEQGAAMHTFIDQQLQSTQAQIQAIQADISRLMALSTPTTAQQQQLQRAQDRLIALNSSFASLVAAMNVSSTNSLTLVVAAEPASSPSSPAIVLNTVLGIIAGVVLSVAVAFLLEYLDDAVRSPEEMQAISGLPALGSVARIHAEALRDPARSLVALQSPRSPAAETFKSLRTNLGFATVDRPVGILVVTSSSAAEGKTTVAANLAVAFAQAGRPTILVDADLRKPELHKLLNLPTGWGLTEALREPTASLDTYLQTTDQAQLRFMSSGELPPNPAELLASQSMRGLTDRLRGAADVVVVDSPPLLAVTDAAVLAGIADGVVLVVDAKRTSRGHLRAGCAALAKVGAPVLGAIYNRLPVSTLPRYDGGVVRVEESTAHDDHGAADAQS